jgi:hypothetical protein
MPSSPVVPPVARSVPAPASTPEGTVAEYQLLETDSIERAPSIDQTNATRLRRIGILRVGDLLRVPAAEVAADLRQLGISHEMVQSWQSQVRLMCGVRGLSSYDARILAACGISEPEQLLKLNPTALRARVREFSATAEGQAILLSGTESELSRVTDWIQKRILQNESAPQTGEKANPGRGTRPARALNAA